MKANEAPKKIYLQEPTKVRTEKKYDNDVEYTRTDTFIEKACDTYCKVCKMPNCRRTECNWLSDFKEHLKTI